MRRSVRLAIIVSHPVQYYVPLYRRLAARDDVAIKVFFTWHGGTAPVFDQGFRQPVAWDVPLTQGYPHVTVPNVARDPGTHHFLGLRNPTLVAAVAAWQPDAVHVTGYAGLSHVDALRAFRRRGIPVLFRGDSHLLDARQAGPGWRVKRAALRTVYSWPAVCLYVGAANKAYYEAFDVPAARLAYCPHSIDVARFAQPADELERQAAEWRRQLGIRDDALVLLFAGKFEPRKRPLELMRAVRQQAAGSVVLIMVGAGELDHDVRALAAADPARFRVLPFQNQRLMPVVHRLGDVVVLPSAYGETWGMAVLEGLACGRPAIVSDRVGCAGDLVEPACGWVFPADDWTRFGAVLAAIAPDAVRGRMRIAARTVAARHAVSATEHQLLAALDRVLPLARTRMTCDASAEGLA